MIISYCFIGVLPSYIKETIHQARCFFKGDIYLIINDLNSIHLDYIKKYNVNIINYEDVKSSIFCEISMKYKSKFQYIPNLLGREELFVRSFERFFVMQNLMKQKNLVDCLFLELDNLIYDDPNKWLACFSNSELCYMFDNIDRYSSGIIYIKNFQSLSGFLDESLNYIQNSREFMSEMTVLSRYYSKNKQTVQILPTYWNDKTMPVETYINYPIYNDTLFDAAAIGIYLLGIDPHHTNGVLVKNLPSKWSYIDFTKHNFTWIKDIDGRNRPFIWNGEKWLLINNLHIHAKNLHEGISLPMTN